MKEITLRPKEQPKVRLEAEVINPAVFAGKGLKEIEGLQIQLGNTRVRLADFFEVSGARVDDPKDLRIVIDGDAGHTKRIGEGMATGEILVRGGVDMYVGARMTGGRIIVEGDADSFAGQQMVGGELVIKGNAKDYVGSSYRGDWRGMRGGTITVEGNAGCENGEFMMGGKIHIKGSAGPFTGLHMKKGLIVVGGNAPRVGAQMQGGSIVVAGKMEKLLPGFWLEGEEENLKIEADSFEGRYLRYSGDHAEGNVKGLLYLKKPI
ncbi:MAG: formylmethanofuran dehydrogenase subunit C [Euryarchaeota archaeon]|nr:formylmethanofuran dehydrogenase subunit C [Euryarchaeota archaeon]